MRTVGYLVLALITAVAMSACGDDDGGQATEATSSPESASKAPVEPTTAGDEAFPEGTHTSEGFGIPVTLTVGDGWKRPVDDPDFFALEYPRKVDAPFGYIAFLLPTQTYNPTESNLVLGPPPTDFVGWITNHRLLNIVDTKDVILGGLEGTELEITMSTVSDFPLFKLSDGDYELRFEDHIRMLVLNAGGSQVLVTYGSDLPTNFDDFEPMAEDVLATVEFAE